MTANAAAREKAAELIERFLAKPITNDELEDSWPLAPSDPAIEEIRHAVWLTYDDLEEQLGPSGGHELLRRCANFLRSDEAYAWPVPRRWQRVLATLVSIGMLGIVKLELPGLSITDESWPSRR